ncbi:MAG: acetylxylan esterase [Planctomycetia bacterium]|nr:acetylxylan esterase [Planctomycetia bacterium]
MKSIKIYISLSAVLLWLCFSINAWAQDTPIDVITIACDHTSQCYEVGEDAVFTISVGKEELAQKGELKVLLTNDDRDRIAEEYIFDLSKNNPVTIVQGIDFPGFIQVRANVTIEGQTINSAIFKVGFSPEKIVQALPKPDDFDEYWKRSQQEVREIPIDLKQTRLEELCNEKHEVYAISFATVGDRRVYGYLSLPKSDDAPFPALVNVPGAGNGVGPEFWLADKGFVVMNMNFLPYEVHWDGETRKKQFDEFNKTLDVPYQYNGVQDRNTYFFRAAYLGIDRAVDWLAEQPYVDSRRIGYYGSSQGGASGLILGGLNSHFCALVTAVPASCDHGGHLTGRSPGWPRIADYFRQDEKVIEEMRYLDAVNFASRINNAYIDVTVGFIDNVCCPSSVYAAYNAIPSAKKTMLHELKLGHQNGRQYSEALERLMQRVKNNTDDPDK